LSQVHFLLLLALDGHSVDGEVPVDLIQAAQYFYARSVGRGVSVDLAEAA
jgi:hypothetical protein